MRVLLLLGLLGVVGCGPHVGAQGQDVGAACTANSQCSSVCLTGYDRFPGGMCSIACTSDIQCPKGSACIDPGKNAGGFCAVTCSSTADCNAFGRGFTCSAVDRVGVAGQALICEFPA